MGENTGVVEAGDVLVHTELRQRVIHHAYLLPLIDKGRAALEHIHRGEHFAALRAVMLAAVAADDARMVMVFDVEGAPCASLKLYLPFAESTLHLQKIEGSVHNVGHEAVGLHVREVD